MSAPSRRAVVAGGGVVALLGGAAFAKGRANGMYGMVGKMKAQPGKGAALARLMLAGTGAMPGCLAYVVSADAKDADTLWIFEAWDTKASHDASLQLPAVRETIAEARPLIAGFEPGAELDVLGGVGLSEAGR